MTDVFISYVRAHERVTWTLTPEEEQRFLHRFGMRARRLPNHVGSGAGAREQATPSWAVGSDG